MYKVKMSVLSILFLLFCGVIWSQLLSSSSNTKENYPQDNSHYSYLALGDSYSIGQSVNAFESWPVQLTHQLNEKGMFIDKTKIIAQTGWRTEDMLYAAQNQLDSAQQFDMVSLLIGVNNEFQGRSVDDFQHEFQKCLKYAISKCKTYEQGVFVVSIPDYGYTPYGKNDRQKISKRLDKHNKICRNMCDSFDVSFYDITPISRADPDNKTMVAKDGLHPSGKQYKLWVDSFADQVYKLFNP